MPGAWQTLDKNGRPHPKFRFWYYDEDHKRKWGTGTESYDETMRIAKRLEYECQRKRELIDLGIDPEADMRPAPKLFGEALQEYYAWGDAQGGLPWSPGHRKDARRHLRWWQAQLKPKFMSDLQGVLPRVEEALRRYRNTVILRGKGKGKKPAGKTVQSYADGLVAFINWCMRLSYIKKNPLAKLTRYDTTPEEEKRALTAEDVQRILATCPPHRRILYETAIATGLRANELRNLTIHDLDIERSRLRLRKLTTKGKREALVPLPAPLVEKLAREADLGIATALYAERPPKKGRRSKVPDEPLLYVPIHTARDLHGDMKKAGVPIRTSEGKVDFHALRNAFDTFVVESTSNLKEAQDLMRHKDPRLTMSIYARVRKGGLHRVAEKVWYKAMIQSGDVRNSCEIENPDSEVGVSKELSGGGYGDRTRDLKTASLALSQLS